MERINRPSSRKEVNGWGMVYYLAELGHEPERIWGENYWYLLPPREKRTASFKVYQEGNVWYDQGSIEGGSLMNFCIAYFRCDEEEVLNRLSNGSTSLVLPRSRSKEPDDPASHIHVTDVQPLTARYQLCYLTSRNIPVAIGQRYCKEVTYSLYRKNCSAIGFLNRFGGYELRNAEFKGSSSPKDIILLQTGAKLIIVFDGFSDFLSYQAGLQQQNGPSDILVLNPLSLINRAIPFLERYLIISLYLNQGQSGRLQTDELLTQFPDAMDKSSLFKGSDDLNEWHCRTSKALRLMKKMKLQR